MKALSLASGGKNVAMEDSYKLFNTESKQAVYVVCNSVVIRGKKHLYVDAGSAVTAVPKMNQGHNGYTFWFFFSPWINQQ